MGESKNNGEKGINVLKREHLPSLWSEDMDRWFDRAMRGFGIRPFRMWSGWPRMWREEGWLLEVDVFQKEGNLIVRADMPGVRPEDIEVYIEGDSLILQGKRHEEKEVTQEHYYCSERASGEFYRAIALPKGVISKEVEAKFSYGVLEVTIPMPKTAKSEKVSIKVK